MKRDIRHLFREEDTQKVNLPEHHRQEFYDKLKASRPTRKTNNRGYYLFKVAAMLLLLVAFVFTLKTKLDQTKTEVAAMSIDNQMEVIEKQYLESIDREWENFISVAKDEKLVQRYREKLSDLDDDYKEITKQFRSDKNNIIVIEDLVENLKTRLKLLKDIQNHIKLLNQINEQHEHTI